MIRMEIHPGEGGADAEAFATELAGSIARHSNTTTDQQGRVVVLHRL